MQSNIDSLAVLLTKLWKIRHQTDPSAPVKKQELHIKYKTLCQSIASEYQDKHDWTTLVKKIHQLSFPVSNKENRLVLQEQFRKKLIADLEVYFITKYVPTTLVLPKKSKKNNPTTLKKKIFSKPKQPTYTANHILQMAKQIRLRQNASHHLQEVINTYREIDPVKIEKQIESYLNKNKI